MKTSKYPIDFGELEKGSIIDSETIVKAFGVQTDHRDYSKVILNLRGQIIDYFAYQEIVITVRQVKDCLEIVEDENAIPYNRRWVAIYEKRYRDSIARIAGADVTRLSFEMAKERERILLIETMKMRAMTDAAKRARISWRDAQEKTDG